MIFVAAWGLYILDQILVPENCKAMTLWLFWACGQVEGVVPGNEQISSTGLQALMFATQKNISQNLGKPLEISALSDQDTSLQNMHY